MKFSMYAIAALAMSSSCFVSAAAPKSKKSAKKVTNGANGPYGGPTNGIPIGDKCQKIHFNSLFDCDNVHTSRNVVTMPIMF